MVLASVMGLASCSDDNGNDTPSGSDVTVTASVTSSNSATWGQSCSKNFSKVLTITDVDKVLEELGFYKDGKYVSYTQTCAKSQKDKTQTLLNKNLEQYYLTTMEKVNNYDFSKLIADADKNLPYHFSYKRDATIGNSSVALQLNICNPQLVKGMAYVTSDDKCPIKSVEVLNGDLNHFNTVKCANVIMADGKSVTSEIFEGGATFFLQADAFDDYTFAYNNGTDQSKVTLKVNDASYVFEQK